MISIIICSIHSSIDKKLETNIQATIGNVPFEIVLIDNSKGKHSICSAYNEGVLLAKYPYCVFMHEDILFVTKDWGTLIVNGFVDEKVGMLAVVGTFYLDNNCVYWFSSKLERGDNQQLFSDGSVQIFHRRNNPELGNDVVAADGQFLVIRKALFDSNILKWDDLTFKQFHFYDLDISMQVITKGYKIRILTELLEQHASLGTYNESFYIGSLIFHEKWDAYLPVHSETVTDEHIALAKKNIFRGRCEAGILNWKSKKRLSLWPYKFATKICSILNYSIW